VKKDTITRFPRTLRAEDLAAIALLLRSKPKISIRVTRNRRAVQYKFLIPVPDDLKKSYPAAWVVLFDLGIKDWTRALNSGYHQARSGKDKKPIKKFIEDFILRAYRDALSSYLQRILHHPRYDHRRRAELEAFSKHSVIKKSRPDPTAALWAMRRRNELMARIKEVRPRLKTKQNLPSSDLFKLIRENVDTILSEAELQEDVFPKIAKSVGFPSRPTLFFITSPSVIAEAYIRCEGPAQHYDLGGHQIRTLCNFAKEIDKLSSTLPRPL
jgi:hypothetical protein